MHSLPNDLKRTVALQLELADVSRLGRTSKEWHSALSSDFYRVYCETRGWAKDRERDSWRETALLRRKGMVKRTKKYLLDDISWELEKPPDTAERQFVEFRSGGIDYMGTCDLSEKDWGEIVFRDATCIRLPLFEKKPDGTFFFDSFYVRPKRVFTLQPDTPVGSTLRHVLRELYRNLYGLPAGGPLIPLAEIAPGFHLDYENSNFLGLLCRNGQYEFDCCGW